MIPRRHRHAPLPAALALSAALVACLLEPVDAPPQATAPARETAAPATPTPSPAGPGVGEEICALMATGELFCWDTGDVGEAIVVPGRYIAVEESGGETCAITEAGGSVCWGAGRPADRAPP